MTPVERASIPDEDELLDLLSDKARSGNVAAIKALLDRQARDGDRTPSAFDAAGITELTPRGRSKIEQLAAKRRRSGGMN